MAKTKPKTEPQDALDAMELAIATVHFTLTSTMLYGRQIDRDLIPKLPKETHDAYEKRTWRERCHADSQGRLFIPARAFKKMLENTAKYKGEKIGHGQGNKQWGAKFKQGLSIEGDVLLEPTLLKDEIEGRWEQVPADGRPGGAVRVKRCFPMVQPGAGGVLRIILLDPFIQKEKVEEYLRFGGIVNGLGVWRPQVGGSYGRFTIDSVEWEELSF